MSFFGKVDFQQLTYTEQTIYNYLRNNVDKIQYLHVRDVANEAHASASSVMRLVRKMGFLSYMEFKEYVKNQRQKNFEESQKDPFCPFCPEDFPENLNELLDELAQKIIESDNVIFTGVGTSGVICDYASRRFASIGVNTFSFSDFTFPISSKLKNVADTCVIALSISGETSEIIEILESLSTNKDIFIAALTPQPNSAVAHLSHLLITYHVKERRVNLHDDFSSQLPSVFLIEKLSELVFQRSPLNI